MNNIVFSSWGGAVVDNRRLAPNDYQSVENVDLPEHFKQDESLKALIGWYGIVLRSDEIDIVDLCRAYMSAVHENSCGKCIPCRTGTGVMANLLDNICQGQGCREDLATIRFLASNVSETAKCNIGQSGPVPILHALTHFADDFAQVIDGKRTVVPTSCHATLTAPCMDACPIHLDIPQYVELIKEGRFEESLAVIQERLPIPGIVGRVCVRPCEEHCRRANLDEPISIKYLKRFVADHALSMQRPAQFQITPSEKTGRVAIVGAGPAGVTCAYHLARKGHQVVIFERYAEPGGMSAMGIPDYRLPRNVLQGEVEEIRRMGVTIRYNTWVGEDVTLPQLEEEYDAVFVAIGAQGSTSMRMPGEDQGYTGFIPGVKFLEEINMGKDPYPEGSKVVVVGGGNVAIDCVRCAFRIGKQDVHLVYRRTRKEMPADEVEIHDAEEEQVQFHFLTTPVRMHIENNRVIGLECIKMKLGAPDKSGRRRPVPIEGSEFTFDCDTVVPAIGQSVDLSLLAGVEGIQTTRWNTIVVDEVTKQTDRPKLFSAGDCETGPGALITACAGGRKAAINIDRMINGKDLVYDTDDHFDRLFRQVQLYDQNEDVGAIGGVARKQLVMLPPDSRKLVFDEVEQGFATSEAIAEADRCLRCYRVAMVAV